MPAFLALSPPRVESRGARSRPTASGVTSPSWIAPSRSSHVRVGPLGEISSRPSALCTTSARSAPSSRSTATIRSPSAGDGTPSSCRFTPAGLASGPRTLKIVRIPISRRTGPA